MANSSKWSFLNVRNDEGSFAATHLINTMFTHPVMGGEYTREVLCGETIYGKITSKPKAGICSQCTIEMLESMNRKYNFQDIKETQ